MWQSGQSWLLRNFFGPGPVARNVCVRGRGSLFEVCHRPRRLCCAQFLRKSSRFLISVLHCEGQAGSAKKPSVERRRFRRGAFRRFRPEPDVYRVAAWLVFQYGGSRSESRQRLEREFDLFLAAEPNQNHQINCFFQDALGKLLRERYFVACDEFRVRKLVCDCLDAVLKNDIFMS